MNQLIQIGNLADSVDGQGLAQLFAVHGDVRSATVMRHRETGRSTGVGIVEMASRADGTAAIAALHHREHCGRSLSVCWSVEANNCDADRQHMFGPMNMTSDDVTEQ
jgi:RNA recognition motif-containing protein